MKSFDKPNLDAPETANEPDQERRVESMERLINWSEHLDLDPEILKHLPQSLEEGQEFKVVSIGERSSEFSLVKALPDGDQKRTLYTFTFDERGRCESVDKQQTQKTTEGKEDYDQSKSARLSIKYGRLNKKKVKSVGQHEKLTLKMKYSEDLNLKMDRWEDF